MDCFRWLLLGSLCFIVPGSLQAQAISLWNNSGSDWATGSNWSAGTVPTNTTTAIFGPRGSSYTSPVVDPNLSTAQSAAFTMLAMNPRFTGWEVTGSGSLTMGATSSVLQVLGPAASTINGPSLLGIDSSNAFNTFIGSGSSLTLSGNTAVTAFQGSAIIGGTLRLDNTTTNLAARLLNTAVVTLNSGGTLELIGHADGTTTDFSVLNTGSNTIGGVNVIRVTPNGSLTRANFANSGAFVLRPGTRGIYHFVAGNGALGDANGAQVTFAGSPNLGVNGLLAGGASGTSTAVGFAIATDSGGTDFATWNATNGIVRALPSQTGTTASNLQSYSGSDRVQFNPVANQSATAAITNGSLRISPASGLSLNMGTNALNTVALMLDGANDYAITGTGNLGGGATRYIYINNPSTTLSMGQVIANGAIPTVVAGPGFLSLTGTATQNNLTTTNRLVLSGGVLRANNQQIGFSSAGAGVLSFAGGTLEITGGANGTGTTADFRRPLGSSNGNVTWGSSGNESGNGGFSAFGSNASVNIGGAASPTLLRWANTDFVPNGYALTFGSTKSNAVLTFLNPIQLDNTQSYAMREIRVTGGVGGDRTILAGAISGNASADLVKTGTGTLELAGASTFNGNLLVHGGNLRLSGSVIPSTVTTGTFASVNTGATLSGTGTLGSLTNPVNLFVGGALSPGNSPGRLTVNGSVALNSTATYLVEANGSSTAGTDYDQLRIGTNGSLSLGNASLSLQLGYTPSGTDVLFLTDNLFGGAIAGNFQGLGEGASITLPGYSATITYQADYTTLALTGGNDVAIYNFTAVPEPGTVALILLMGYFGTQVYLRRSVRKQSSSPQSHYARPSPDGCSPPLPAAA